MTNIRLENGKLVIATEENRGDAIISQTTIYTHKTTNQIRNFFKEN